jgi:hypothetical protein
MVHLVASATDSDTLPGRRERPDGASREHSAGGVPEEEGVKLSSSAEVSKGFLAIKATHPQAWFWPSGPGFERTDTSPLGGPRFVFRYRVPDGCHACAVLGYVRRAELTG